MHCVQWIIGDWKYSKVWQKHFRWRLMLKMKWLTSKSCVKKSGSVYPRKSRSTVIVLGFSIRHCSKQLRIIRVNSFMAQKSTFKSWSKVFMLRDSRCIMWSTVDYHSPYLYHEHERDCFIQSSNGILQHAQCLNILEYSIVQLRWGLWPLMPRS